MVVTWVTTNSTEKSQVWYALANLDLVKSSTNYYQVANGEQTLFVDGGPAKRSMFIHRVTLDNLLPNSTYSK